MHVPLGKMSLRKIIAMPCQQEKDEGLKTELGRHMIVQ